MNPPKHAFTSIQMQQLRAQIMAYRYLARNQPLSPEMLMAIQGKKNEMPMGMPNSGSNAPQVFQQSRSPADTGILFLAVYFSVTYFLSYSSRLIELYYVGSEFL